MGCILIKIKEYTIEPIIRLIIYIILFIILISGIIFYVRYHADYYYDKPAKKNITNQNSKHKLTNIITRELLQIDIQYRTMLLSRNTKHIENLATRISKSINQAQNILPVLKNGGTVTDVALVNFYNKDEIKEEITYFRQNKETISVDVLNLSPKLIELKLLLDKSSFLLIEEVSKENPRFISDNFELVLVIKQTEALLLRIQESVNKICYDIKQANIKSEKRIIKTQSYVTKILLSIEIVGNSLVILLAIIIAIKIFNILKTKKEADNKIEQANQALKKHRKNLEYLVKERTKKLEKAQKELLIKAVEAGRAQLSSMVLHNIGNAITPVIINFKTLKTSELCDINQYLTQCYNDFKNHKQDLGSYVTKDERGKKVAVYMGELIEAFETERQKQDEKFLKIETGLDYISEILSLQQSYSSAKLGTKQKINFNFLVKDSIKMQQSSIDKRNITLTEEFQDNIPELVIEKNKLMQVMVNLIKNACDAITQLNESDTEQKENFINITTSFSDNTSSDSTSDKKIKFIITDSGVGVEEDKLNKIFEFGVSTKGSSGFGLYYCRTFVESNNGTLKVESHGKDGGTTFIMEFRIKT
jgi:signal transduction histidine kinase